MSNRSRKHKRIVRQRALTAVMTIFILAVISVGIYYGAKLLLADYKASRAQKEAEAKARAEEEARLKAEEEAANASPDDDWYIAEDEEIVDDYADVPEISENSLSESQAPKTDETVENKLTQMTIEEKVAQLFIITPEDLTGVNVVTAAGEATKEALKEHPVGGIIYSAPNILEPEQLKGMLSNIQSFSKELTGLPLFLCVDEEGGTVTRIAQNEAFGIEKTPSLWDIGLSNDPDYAYSSGESIAKYLKEYGFNVDFAPDADIVSTSENSAIGIRSFGGDPETVSKLSWQFASGLEDNGITACFKHFPGLGSTEEDTHLGMVSLRKTQTEIEANELVPFENAVTSGANMIMAGHISCPLITGDDTPASLSSVMLTDILRTGMGYNGIIITDSLKMNAVTDNYSPGEAAKLAITAGADLLLMPESFEEAYNALLEAVSSGEITEDRIDDSVRRILSLKSKA